MWGLYLIFLLFITYYIQILINPLQEIWSALSVPYLTTIQPNGSLKWGLCLICIFLIYIYIFKYFINPLSEIWGCLKTGVQHSSRKSSTTHSYHCVQYLCASKQCLRFLSSNVCAAQQCLRFLSCAQMLMHATAHGGIVRESALVNVASGFSVRLATI